MINEITIEGIVTICSHYSRPLIISSLKLRCARTRYFDVIQEVRSHAHF
jgi:hypothetical protein